MTVFFAKLLGALLLMPVFEAIFLHFTGEQQEVKAMVSPSKFPLSMHQHKKEKN